MKAVLIGAIVLLVIVCVVLGASVAGTRADLADVQSQLNESAGRNVTLKARLGTSEDQTASLRTALATASQDAKTVQRRYTKLLHDYSGLLALAKIMAVYLNTPAPSYPVYDPINCTSYMIGTNTYTNCY